MVDGAIELASDVFAFAADLQSFHDLAPHGSTHFGIDLFFNDVAALVVPFPEGAVFEPVLVMRFLGGSVRIVPVCERTIDADAFKTASGDLESSLRMICQKVHAHGEMNQ